MGGACGSLLTTEIPLLARISSGGRGAEVVARTGKVAVECSDGRAGDGVAQGIGLRSADDRAQRSHAESDGLQ